MSDLSINPVALHLVSKVFTPAESKKEEEESVQLGVGAPVIANIKNHEADDSNAIKSASEAQAALTVSRDLIMSDAVNALSAQGNIPNDVLDLLED